MTLPSQSEALGTLRVQIDALDQQLLALLNQRARVAEQVGDIKRAEGSPFSGRTASRKSSRRSRAPTRGRC